MPFALRAFVDCHDELRYWWVQRSLRTGGSSESRDETYRLLDLLLYNSRCYNCRWTHSKIVSGCRRISQRVVRIIQPPPDVPNTRAAGAVTNVEILRGILAWEAHAIH